MDNMLGILTRKLVLSTFTGLFFFRPRYIREIWIALLPLMTLGRLQHISGTVKLLGDYIEEFISQLK